MDSNQHPEGDPTPVSPLPVSEDTGGHGDSELINRPLGNDSSFQSGLPPQKPAERPLASTSQWVPVVPEEETQLSDSPIEPDPPESPPPGPPDDDDFQDDGPGDGDNGDHNRRRRWPYWLSLVVLVAAAVAAGIWHFTSDDGDDGDKVVGQPTTEEEVTDFCQSTPTGIDHVGVLKFSDRLDGTINPLWSDREAVDGDAQSILDGIVTDLFSTDGDGCTPQGLLTGVW